MDKRRELTKRLIADGFKSLMLRLPFEKISIRTITDEVGIRRPSFYNHFQDKYDLLEWVIADEIVEPSRALMEQGEVLSAIEGMLERLSAEADFYRRACAVTGQNGFREGFIRELGELFLLAVPEDPALPGDLPRKVVALYHAMCFDTVVELFLSARHEVAPGELMSVYRCLTETPLWGNEPKNT